MYRADPARYGVVPYRRCGASGLLLPVVSLGLWHNFGDDADPAVMREIVCCAFDHGVTHFDLANNYGPAPGAAERNFGRLLATDLKPYRDELIVSTKAGYLMWDGPYGEWGSKKYLVASLDQSLRRLGLDYVDIFYHHRPDPDTPLEEIAHTLDLVVRQGKALYVGVSNYGPEDTARMAELLREKGTPFVIHQPRYNLLDRRIEHGLTDELARDRLGCICFSPLAQGLLTDRYFDGIPTSSRAARRHFLKPEAVEASLPRVRALDEIARSRGETLAQMALAWVLRLPVVTSVLVGASSAAQLLDSLGAAHAAPFTEEQLHAIDKILAD